MVAVWIILGFLASVPFVIFVGLKLGAKATGLSVKEYLESVSAILYGVNKKKNRTQQVLSMEIVYEDHIETLTLE